MSNAAPTDKPIDYPWEVVFEGGETQTLFAHSLNVIGPYLILIRSDNFIVGCYKDVLRAVPDYTQAGNS